MVAVPVTRCRPRLRRWALEIALMVLDRIRSGRGPCAIWAFGRDVYYGPLADGLPKRATLIGVYDDRAQLRRMADDIETVLDTEAADAAVA